MKQRPEWDLIQQAQMRMFLASCGVSKDTVETALKVRRNEPIENKPAPRKGRKRKAGPPSAE